MCVYLLSEELLYGRGLPHAAATQRVRQDPPALLGGAHAVLTPHGQRSLPGRVDQRQAHHLLARLLHPAAQAQQRSAGRCA